MYVVSTWVTAVCADSVYKLTLSFPAVIKANLLLSHSEHLLVVQYGEIGW